MNIDQHLFEFCCPVAVSPEPDIFNAVSARFPALCAFIRDEVLSPVIWEALDPVDTDAAPADVMGQLAVEVCRYVCSVAFLETLPHLDLVLTATGFGVVSNGNVAPASSDRVERLRESLSRDGDMALDYILFFARKVDGWPDSENAARWISSLFWRGRDMELIEGASQTRASLREMAPVIARAEAWLKELVSPAFFDRMCERERSDDRSFLHTAAVGMARRCVAAYISRPQTVGACRRLLLGFLEGNPEAFPEYMDSSAYRANHFKPYENRKDDPCFFF